MKLTCILLVFIFISVISYGQSDTTITSPLSTQSTRDTPNILADTLIANSYFSKADSLSKAAQYDSAIYYFRQAGILYKDAALWKKYITCQNNIGWHLGVYKAEYNNAIQILEKTLETGLNILGNDHLKVAGTYNNIGVVSWMAGNYEKALQNYHRSLTIMLNILSENHQYVATSYNNIGLVYNEKGEYNKAMEYYNKSLSIRLKSLGRKHPDVAQSYNNMGIIYKEKGDYYTALEYYGQSLYVWSKALGPEHPNVAANYNNIGMVYREIGDYGKSLEYCKKSLSIWLKSLGSKHPRVATCYNNIGVVYHDKGDYDKALQYYNQSLSIKLQALGLKHPDVAQSYENIALIYLAKDPDELPMPDFTERQSNAALEYFQKALTIWLINFGTYHPHVGKFYNNFAKIYIKKREYTTALVYHQKAILSLFRGFTDTTIYVNPVIPESFKSKKEREAFRKKINSMPVLLDALVAKASVFEQRWNIRHK